MQSAGRSIVTVQEGRRGGGWSERSTLAAEGDDERATTVSGLAYAWTEQSQAMERKTLPHTITAEERQRQRRAWESWAWQRVLDMAGVAGRELAVLDYRPSKVSSRTVHMQGGVAPESTGISLSCRLSYVHGIGDCATTPRCPRSIRHGNRLLCMRAKNLVRVLCLVDSIGRGSSYIIAPCLR